MEEPRSRNEKLLSDIYGEMSRFGISEIEIDENTSRNETLLTKIYETLKQITPSGGGGESYSKAEIDEKIQVVRDLIETANGDLQELEKSLQEYVKNTDLATLSVAGAVKVANDTDMSSDGVLVKKHTGIRIEEHGVLGLTETTSEEIDAEGEGRLALHPNNIPHMMKNYGIDKTTIADILEKLDSFTPKTKTETIQISADGNTPIHDLKATDIILSVTIEEHDYVAIPYRTPTWDENDPSIPWHVHIFENKSPWNRVQNVTGLTMKISYLRITAV